MVVSRHGRYRFQTGLITASLLKRGLAMEEAFAISTELRQQLRGREEIGTEELEEMLQALVLEHLGENAFSSMGWNTVEIGTESPLIRGQATLLPFSRGILLRYLVTAGLEPEAAMSLAQEIQRWLRTRGLSEVGQLEVDNEVELLLRTRHSEAHARRFRLTGLIRRAEKPVIILIGGATGTGKSTLATELAFRLGIRLVTSTDMIRETMRTVLSADVVPGLHDHSFRGMIQGGQVLSDPRERVLAGFRQQAAQVAVGIRAVIRRAIRENSSMIVEGTHLRPPFTSFLPASGAARLCGLVLAVPEESRHRDRFPRRAREQAMRDPDDYLDSFQSVRWIHDDLLAGAERAGCVVVGNEDLDSTVTGVVEFLSRSLHFDEANSHPTSVALPKGDEEDEAPRVPTLFLILDGLADEPNPALGQKTPLAAAATPYLCMLAGAGGQGQIRTGHTEGHIPETDEGLLALLGLGQSLPDPKPGRGLLEALGSGIPLPPNAVVFRGNLATVAQDRNLTDRRAGRIRAGMEDLTSELRDVVLSNGLVGHVFPGHEHRVLVMLQGSGLSEAVSDTDPGGDAAIQAILAPRPTDDSPEAARTAEALRELLEFTHERLQ